MPKSLQSSLLIEILDLGVRVGVYEEKLFREYLELPLVNQYNVLKEKVAAKLSTSHHDPGHWNRYIGNV